MADETVPDAPKRHGQRARGHGPASGIPAGGEGWGGPASGKPARPFGAVEKPPRNGKATAIRELLAPHVAAAITAITAIQNDAGHPRRLDAARDVLDRVYGKPMQPTITADITKPISEAENDAIRESLRDLVGLPPTIDGEVVE